MLWTTQEPNLSKYLHYLNNNSCEVDIADNLQKLFQHYLLINWVDYHGLNKKFSWDCKLLPWYKIVWTILVLPNLQQLLTKNNSELRKKTCNTFSEINGLSPFPSVCDASFRCLIALGNKIIWISLPGKIKIWLSKWI